MSTRGRSAITVVVMSLLVAACSTSGASDTVGATTTQPPTTTSTAATTTTAVAVATVAIADEPGDVLTFKSRTFGIDARRHLVVERSAAGDWQLRDEFFWRFRPTITATADRMLVVSPAAGEGPRACRQFLLFTAVSSTGEDFRLAAINDLGPDILRQETRPHRRNLPCMYLDGGGDAIGPKGILIVRVITRCCIDPYSYPHFWFSPDGGEWARVRLPPDMVGWVHGTPSEWGPPRATVDGFAIDVTYAPADDGDPPVVVTWESSDGLNWSRRG